MAVSRNKLDKKDITKIGLLSLGSQFLFSFERMQTPGFVMGMLPAFEKIYGDDKEQIALAMQNNMDFINTEPHMLAMLQGLVVSLEEAGEDRQLIKNLTAGLFGPLAGLGDAVFWFTLLPVTAAIAVSFSQQGSVLGPIIFFVIQLLAGFSRIYFAQLGYRLGVGSLEILRDSGAAITKAAGVLGVMVIGGLIPAYVSLSFPEELVLFDVVSVQGIFDTIMPNILPFAFVLGLFGLFRKKQVSVTAIIVGVIVFSIALAYFGIL